MVNKPASNSDLPIPKRLRAVRAIEGYETAKEFAEALGITPNRYGNIEAGSANLSYEVAMLIVDHVPGCSLDWLWRGEERGLTTAFRLALRQVYEPSGRSGAVKGRTTPSPRASIKGRSAKG